MGKVTLGKWTSKNEQFTRKLKSGLVSEGKNYKNLMKRTGISLSTIYKRYDAPESIRVSELREFIHEAKLSEDDILDFLFADRR